MRNTYIVRATRDNGVKYNTEILGTFPTFDEAKAIVDSYQVTGHNDTVTVTVEWNRTTIYGKTVA